MIRALGQAKKKTRDSPPELRGAAEAGRGLHRPGRPPHTLTHARLSTRRKRPAPGEARRGEARRGGGGGGWGFLQFFPESKKKPDGNPPPSPSCSQPNAELSFPASSPAPPAPCARLAALGGDRAPAQTHTGCKLPLRELPALLPVPWEAAGPPPRAPPPGAHAGPLMLAAF